MAATVTVTRQVITSGAVQTFGTVSLGTPYVAGGVPVSANDFKLGDPNFDLSLRSTTTGHQPAYDKINKKVKVFTQGAATGATAAAALTTGGLVLTDFGIEGLSRLSGSLANDTVKFGPLLELSVGADLTNVTFAFDAIGAY